MISLKEPHHFFLAIALIFGLIFTFLIPPFQSPDEYNHFYKSWRVSDGAFVPEKHDTQRLGGEIPESLELIKNQFFYLKDNYNAKTSFHSVKKAALLPLNIEKKKFVDYPNTAVYAPTSYLPQAFGILIGKLLSLSPLYILYITRIFNLLAWILLVYIAIQKLNIQKWSMVFVAMVPSSLVMAASANSDNITNGLCFWIVSIFISSHHFLLIKQTFLCCIVCINKIVFAPLVLLYWINKKSIFYFAVMTLMAFLSAFVWGKYAQQNIITYENYDPNYRQGLTMNEGVNPSAQLQYVLQHPFTFAKIATSGFIRSIPATTVHLFGKFGWEKNYLPTWSIVLLIGGFFITVFSQPNGLNKKARIILTIAVILAFMLFCIIMYMIWYPVGSQVLDNFGGRYFFVFMMIIPLIIGNDLLKYNVSMQLNFSKLILIIGNIITIFCILNRYYLS
ncbi:MAG: hypothetical protein RLZZ546_830 [Bacteroidota bacterium]|jgi:uncharacterized membrane protein